MRMREDIYIERKIVSGRYIPDGFSDVLAEFEETELTPLQTAYISEKITSSNNNFVFVTGLLAVVGALGAVFGSDPKTALYVMLFYGAAALLYKPVRNLWIAPVKTNFECGNYKAYKLLVTEKFVNMIDSSDAPSVSRQKTATYYLSICGVNVNIPFECYIGAQEGGFITGVLVDTGDKKWFIVCSPSL
ncbi:MAG: hypothetical protein ACI4SF_01185 [Oscillospiraceae bacterium]